MITNNSDSFLQEQIALHPENSAICLFNLLNSCQSHDPLEILITLFKAEFLHRMFWTDLHQQGVIKLIRSNGYLSDDLFIMHEILGREFEDAEVEDKYLIGGVLSAGKYDSKGRVWVSESSGIDLEMAKAMIQGNSNFRTMVEVIKDNNISSSFYPEELGAVLLTISTNEFENLYGFKPLERANDYIIEIAKHRTPDENYWVDAEFSPNFQETLSWGGLTEVEKVKIFKLLINGFELNEDITFPRDGLDSSVKDTALHFLGCIALHAETSESIIQNLAILEEPLLDEIIDQN